ncbi:hypothetical protein [Parathalassolituus penaei]|uniref:Uncharacterized protein n=1 Tax=Parathalassolituus penaei TaxID=2997323 RepID=A0A9X3EDZ3_9GAMM|nr:hypothetical protein [Parathalassolituus penaei]MCY0965853.1 hypothetical protein [Parathalassolituus penaei]
MNKTPASNLTPTAVPHGDDSDNRGSWFDSLGRDPLHPVLPRPGCGYSVLAWANRFLHLYIDQLARQKRAGDVTALIQVLEVFALLDHQSDERSRRRETQAYEALADHYDHLRSEGVDESLLEAFQLLLLLMISIDQLRKQSTRTGFMVSYASVEESIDAQLRHA